MPYIIPILFFGIPGAAVVFWIVSLVLYCAARRNPGEAQRLKGRKRMLIAASAIAGVLVGVVLAVVALAAMSIAYM